jgi:hypothetical protein
MDNLYAVVTGASQGLGKSFALELAKKGINLILISLPNQNLSELCSSLHQQFGIQVAFKETDLSIKENVLSITNWVNDNFNVNILVNNAGIGGTKKFEDATAFYIEKIIQLNVLATSLITHQLLSNLKKQKKAYILNVSSLAALSPIGYKTVYPASKAFVHSFSRGLYQELKDTNVFVSVVNPGAMATNAEVSERIEKQGFLGKLTLLDPDKVARRCIKQVLKRDSVIMVNPFSWLILNILPIWVRLPLMSNAIKKEVQ